MAEAPGTFSWIGDSIDQSMESVVSTLSSNVITDFLNIFMAGGTLYLILLGFAISYGYIQSPITDFLKTAFKFVLISSLALNASTYQEWVVNALEGMESGLASAFSLKSQTSTGFNSETVYQILDKAQADGFSIGANLLEHAATRDWDDFGGVIYDYLCALVVYLSTLIMLIPAAAMIFTVKIILRILFGIGPFFIAMVMFGNLTIRWFDNWFNQIMTSIMQISLVVSVVTMGIKLFTILTDRILNNQNDQPFGTILELLIVAASMLYLMRRAFELGGLLGGGLAAAGISLQQIINGVTRPARTVGNVAGTTYRGGRTAWKYLTKERSGGQIKP